MILSGPSSSNSFAKQMCAAAAAAPVHDHHHHQIVKSEKRKKSLCVDSLSFSFFFSFTAQNQNRVNWQIEQSNYQWCSRSSSGKSWVVLINGRLLNKGKARRAALMKFMTLTQAQNREVLPVLASFSWAHKAQWHWVGQQKISGGWNCPIVPRDAL